MRPEHMVVQLVKMEPEVVQNPFVKPFLKCGVRDWTIDPVIKDGNGWEKQRIGAFNSM